MPPELPDSPQPPPLPTGVGGQPSALSVDQPQGWAHPLLAGRLHPFTLVFAVWEVARGALLPLIAIFWFGNSVAGRFLLFFFVVLPLVFAIIRYFTFRYRMENGELVVSQGVLAKTERHIPLNRVQDIRLEQGVLHRLLKVTSVEVETAGGQGVEASLSVLATDEAERLRSTVFAELARQGERTRTATVQPTAEGQVIRELDLKELVLAGLTSNRTASFIAILLIAFKNLDDMIGRARYERILQKVFSRVGDWVMSDQGMNWVHILVAVMAVVLLGLAFSVVGSVLTFYGFRLTRRGEDIQRSYGLLTRRASSLPRRRIQILKIDEPFLRRLLGRASLFADTAGGQGGGQEDRTSGQSVLVPLMPRAEVDALLPSLLPSYESDQPRWSPIARCAIRRGTVIGGLVLGLIAATWFAMSRNAQALVPLLLVPAVYALNVASYRHIGFSLGDAFFRIRRGWLGRSTFIIPVHNTQCIVLRQSPLDRRWGVGRMAVDTAGQTHTGGTPVLDNVPWEQAVATARAIAHRADSTPPTRAGEV